MSLPTTEFPATLPYTSDAATAASTSGTASAGNAGSGGRTAAPPSSPLPGDAADFAQAVHGASPQQDSMPGQPAPMHDTEPAPQGRQSAQPGQSGQSPQRGADAASSARGQQAPNSAGQTGQSDSMRTSGQTDTPRQAGTPGEADEKASTGKTSKPDSRGDAILSTLGGAATAEPLLSPPVFTAQPGGAAEVTSAEIAGIDQRVLTQLVDSILVSAQEGKQEVHIKVQDAVLKDTTIVVRLQDGQLEVQLRTGDSYSSQLLHQNVDTLRHALEGRSFGQPASTLSSPAQVQVRVEDRETSQDDTGQQGQQGQRGQQDQRSRGNFLWDRDE